MLKNPDKICLSSKKELGTDWRNFSVSMKEVQKLQKNLNSRNKITHHQRIKIPPPKKIKEMAAVEKNSPQNSVAIESC